MPSANEKPLGLAWLVLLTLMLTTGACGDGERGYRKPAADSAAKTPKRKFDPTKVGALKGRAIFVGTPLPRNKIDVSRDCHEHDDIYYEKHVVDDDGGFRDVLVHVEGLEDFVGQFPMPEKPARLVQKGCQFIPHVLALRVDQELEVVNADDTTHNYHFAGGANDEINKTQSRPSTNIEQFDEPEIGVKMTCDVHPWMYCYISIFEHPCFTVSATDGSFEIGGIPEGRYKLRLRHENATSQRSLIDIEIRAGETLDLGSFHFRR